MPRSQTGVKPQNFSTFGDLLRYLRERIHLNQRELAALVGYHYSYMSYLEKNLRIPDEATLLGRFIPALELEDEPELSARLLELAKTRQKKTLLPAREAEPAPSETNAHHLPASLTVMLGREREVESLNKILDSDGVRIVTIVGPPGVGKTRLALHIAGQAEKRFSDGVIFVNLTAVIQPELVMTAIASTMEIQKSSTVSILDTLKTELCKKNLLLVLDNFEQVVETAPQLVPLLGGAPNIKILVTSREALRVRGEHEFPLAPLPVPNDSFLDSAVVQLFIERARAVKPDFEIRTETASHVAEICHRLDGLPLAIELAAARVNTLSLSAMIEQFDRRFEWLTRGDRNLPAWRQTLRGTIEWSYNLLSLQERALLNRLSVFNGGWTLEAAEEVCSDNTLCAPSNILELLMQLVDKSLVTVEIESGRYQFLETLRQFAHEKLKESGELELVCQQHCEYYLMFTQSVSPHLSQGGNQVYWLNVMEREHDNSRAALTYISAEPQRAVIAIMKYCVALWKFWLLHGHLTEGRQWMEKALLLDPSPTTQRADVLRCLSDFCVSQGDYKRAQACEEEGMTISKALNDEEGMFSSIAGLATLVGMQGNFSQAADLLEQAVAYRRRMGSVNEMLPLLNNLAIASRRLGNVERARTLYTESIENSRKLGNQRTLGHALHGLGEVLKELKQFDEAVQVERESISIRNQMGDWKGVAYCLDALAMSFFRLDQPALAAQLQSACRKIFGDLGVVTPAATHAEYENFMAEMRTKLGDTAFEEAWDDGQSMSLEKAVSLALGNNN